MITWLYPFGTAAGPFDTAEGPFGTAVGPFGTAVGPFGTAVGPFGTATVHKNLLGLNIFVGPKSITFVGKKHYLCGVCQNFTRSGRFDIKEGHCKRKCQPYLSQEALNDLSNQNVLELQQCEETPAIEEKAPSISLFGNISVAGMDTTEGFLVLLKDIENQKKWDYVAIPQLLVHSYMFTNDQVINYVATGDHINLSRCMLVVLDQYIQLNEKQICGILVAAVVLHDACWIKAQTIAVDCFKTFENLFNFLNSNLDRILTERYARWLCENWLTASIGQIKLIMNLVAANNTQASLDVINFASIIHGPVTSMFIDIAEQSAKLPMASIILKCIKYDHKQQKIEEKAFYDICDLVKSKQSKQIISQYESYLIQVPLFEWSAFIKEKQCQDNILDYSNSFEFVQQLIDAYGETQLNDNLLDPEADDPRFCLMMHEPEIKLNNRQFALAQYCIGKLHLEPRQLWIVPSGQGKSRITAAAALIAIFIGTATKVHMVFENRYLLERDQADFVNFFDMFEVLQQIEYHVGLNFLANDDELILIDEADCFIFEQATQFLQLINGSPCICFTATPDNQDPNGVESKLMKKLGIPVFNYIINGSAANQEEQRQVASLAVTIKDINEVVTAATNYDKVAFILKKAKEGPTLVYCDKPLFETLAQTDVQIFKIDINNVPAANFLRDQLDVANENGQYPLLVAVNDMFAMRGLDYRARKVLMHLIIAKSFDTERGALQGLNRVGRFGDSCKRIRFQDTEVVNTIASAKARGKLGLVLAGLAKSHVAMKPVMVKKIQTKNPAKAFAGKNPPRAQKLTYQHGQQMNLEQLLQRK